MSQHSESQPRFVFLTVWKFVGICMLLAIVWGSLASGEGLPMPPTGDKTNHTVSYFVVMAWFCSMIWNNRMRARIALSLAAMGLAIEFIQPYFGREFEWWDEAANLRGIALAWLLMLTPARTLLARVDGWLQRLTHSP